MLNILGCAEAFPHVVSPTVQRVSDWYMSKFLLMGATALLACLPPVAAAQVESAPYLAPTGKERGAWQKTPTREQYLAAKPKINGHAIDDQGHAELRCGVAADRSLTDCTVKGEPAGKGFDGAARDLIPLFRVDEATAKRVGAGPQTILFFVGWRGTVGCDFMSCTPTPPAPPAPKHPPN